MFLQIAILFNISNKYTKIISIIKLKQKNRIIDLENIIFQLIKYKVIQKKTKQWILNNQPKQLFSFLFLSYLSQKVFKPLKKSV